MLPTKEDACAIAAAGGNRARWKALGGSLAVFGAAAAELDRSCALRGLFRRAGASCEAGPRARGAYPGLDALAASPATAVAFGLWLVLALVGLGLVARCLRHGSTAPVQTVGAGIGLFYLGLVGLLLTGLLG